MRSGILKKSKNNTNSGEDLGKILAQLARLQADQAGRDVKRDERDTNRGDRESRQSRWQLVQLVIALATIVGVLAAFIFGNENLGQQQRAAAQQDQASRYSAISQDELDLDLTIADHPRLISCFEDVTCNANPALTSEEMQQATAIASYVVDFYQYLYDQLNSLGLIPNNGLFVLRTVAVPGVSNEGWVTWSETIVGGFQHSELVCDALVETAGAYEQEFVHAVAITHACPNLSDPGQSPY